MPFKVALTILAPQFQSTYFVNGYTTFQFFNLADDRMRWLCSINLFRDNSVEFLNRISEISFRIGSSQKLICALNDHEIGNF